MATPAEMHGFKGKQMATDDQISPTREGTALCLSGGGYRAMLFHSGVLIRLNELGFLKKLNRVSSVSGGSITSGVLGMNWKRLVFDAKGVATNLDQLVVQPMRKLAGVSIDTQSVIGGVFWRGSVSDWVASKYAEILFAKQLCKICQATMKVLASYSTPQMFNPVPSCECRSHT